ncbi:MAG: hypothetical protein ACI9CO_001292 [Candidatus Azotimanducaceae bacterium]|jgi:hypothetical protein
MKRLIVGISLTAAVLLLSTLYGCSRSQPEPQVKTAQYTAPIGSCMPDPDWLTTPSLPDEIAKDESFCDFYKFSLQSFVYFMSKNEDPKKWNFEDANKFPVYNYASPGSSCNKDLSTLSTSINQAFGNDVIYDQNGNVVFYSVHFTQELCDAPQKGDLPIGTIELKMAWKVLADHEKNRYVSIKKDIVATSADGKSKILKDVTLGLVGIHIIQSTAKHPEMMWGSYEHVDNNPLCKTSTGYKQYSFMSSTCWKSLASGHISDPSCEFNQANNSTTLEGQPSEICRVFADGSDESNKLYTEDSKGNKYDDNKYTENVNAINQLNKSMSESTYFDNTLALKNYQIVGGLWLSNIEKPSTELDNQRGSLEMSNTLMETAIQGGDIPAGKPMLNCFDCHGYTPGKTAETRLSHIFGNLHQDIGKAHSFSGHK